MITKLFIAGIMVISLFLFGLYDVSNWLPYLLVLVFLSLIVWIYTVLIRKGKVHSSYLVLCIFPVLYIMSLLGGVESVEGTVLQFLEWSIYPCILFLFLVGKGNNQRGLDVPFVILSYVLLVSTYLVILSVIPFSSFWLVLNQGISGIGTRLAGFFQYPNAFGIVITSLLLCHLLFTVQESRIHWRMLHGFPIIPYGALLLLTESRGAFLCFLVCWVIGLWLMKNSEYVKYVVLSVVAGIFLYVLSWFLPQLAQGNPWVLLLLGAVSVVFVLMSSWEMATSIKRPKLIPFFTSLTILLLFLDILFKGLLYRMLPEVLQSRFSMGIGTLLERFLYIEDVWKKADSFWLNGLGGMAWRSLMYQTQSSPYISHELHNSYINIMVEVGIAGIILVLIITGYAIIQMFRNRTAYLPSFLAIVLHSFIDFSFSYSFIVFLLLFYFAASYNTEKEIQSKSFQRIGEVIFVLMIGSSVFLSSRFIQADKFMQKGELDRAVASNPFSMKYRLALSIENEDSMEHLISNGLKYEPHHSYAVFQLATLYADHGDSKKAQYAFRESLRLDRFDPYKYEGYIHFLSEQILKEYNRGNIKLASQWVQEAEHLFIELESLVGKFPLPNQRNFHMTKSTRETIEKINQLSRKGEL